MLAGIQITLIVLLLALGIQDFKRRLISLWLLITSGIILILFAWLNAGFSGFPYNAGLNLLLVAILLGACQLYIVIKHRSWVSLFERYMGYGDLVMLLILSLGLEHAVFLVILVVSVFTALITALVYLVFAKKQIQVPLAGFLSVVTGIYFILSLLSNFEFINAEPLNIIHSLGN